MYPTLRALSSGAFLLLAGCDVGPRVHHLQCPRCESAEERVALVDCLARFKVTPPEDDEYGTTVRAAQEACKEAVCPRRPTACTGHAICGQSYCQPEKR